MKKILFTLSVFLCSLTTNAQIKFQKIYVDSGNYQGTVARQTFDGGYILTGIRSDPGSSFPDAIFLIRTNAYGDTLWTRTFGSIDGAGSYDVKQTVDSGFIVTGVAYSFVTNSFDYCLIKVSANGNLNWSKIFGGPGFDRPNSVLQTSDGGYVISGTYNSGTSNVMCLIKTSSSGNLIWTKFFTGGGASSVQQTTDGGYIITGSNTFEMYLIKTNSAGDFVWQKTFYGTADVRGQSVEQTTDGGFIIGGISYDPVPGTHHINLVKTDANGDTLWAKSYGGNGDYRCYSVIQTTDGGYIAGCIAQSSIAFSYDIFLLKTDSNGYLQWSTRYGDINSSELCFSVEQTSDGGYVTGGSRTDGVSGITGKYLLKTDSAGVSGCGDSTFAINLIPYTIQVMAVGNTGVPGSPTLTSSALVVGSGCTITTLCTSVGFAENLVANSMFISPNPSNGNFQMSFGEAIVNGKVEIINLLGERLFSKDIFSETSMEISLPGVSKGVYLVKVSDGKAVYGKRIIID